MRLTSGLATVNDAKIMHDAITLTLNLINRIIRLYSWDIMFNIQNKSDISMHP